MKKNENNNVNYGIGFVDLLAVAFIVLKLLGVITWPWIWVLAPIWGSIAIGIIIIIIMLIIYKPWRY